MIIPLGHEDQTVRRLPWVTFTLVALNVLLFLSVGRGALKADTRAVAALEEAAGYWVQHPYLELDGAVRDELKRQYGAERFELIEAAMDSPLNRPPEDAEVLAREQALLDQLVAVFVRARDAQPFLSWGLIPGRFSLVALFTSMFMHAGWLHLLGNMFILYLAAPSVEDAYGRPLFVGLYAASGVTAALSHVLLYPESMVPLVGASGAIAGVMGAFLVRFSHTRIKFFYWFGLIFRGTFSAPAWLMLPLWLLEQIFYGLLVKSEDGVAYWAHVGGFVFGAAAAYTIRRLEVEEKHIHPRIEAAISLSQHPALEQGMALLEQRSFSDARAAFQEVLADEPRNPDAHLGLWESFAREENPAGGAGHLAKVVEHELRAGELQLAFDHWREGSHLGADVPAALSFRLATQLWEGGSADAPEVLKAVARDPGAGLLAAKAASRLAESAANEAERRQWQAEAVRLEAGGVPRGISAADGPAAIAGGANSAVVATEAAGVRSTLPVGIPAGRPAPAPSPVAPPPAATVPASAGRRPAEPVVQAVTASAVSGAPPRVVRKPLRRLHPSGLAFAVGAGEEVVRYDWVEAIGVGGVSDGGKRYLLADLILRPTQTGARVVVRMASSDFDPRTVMERPELAPLEAFREFVRLVAGAAKAAVLPDDAFVSGAAVTVFPSTAAYESAVFSKLA